MPDKDVIEPEVKAEQLIKDLLKNPQEGLEHVLGTPQGEIIASLLSYYLKREITELSNAINLLFQDPSPENSYNNIVTYEQFTRELERCQTALETITPMLKRLR